jgi:dCMP deaminase
MSRPSWDKYFMEITSLVASRSTCLRRKVGAVIVKDKRILATGYNGAPRGLPHCEEIGCLREKLNIPSGEHQELCRGLHAEQNAIIQAAMYGTRIEGSQLYCTDQPCITCAKMIINAGIIKIFYRKSYPDELARKLLCEAKVEMINYESKKE